MLISMYHLPVASQIRFSQEFTQQHSVCHVFDHGSLRRTVLKSDTVANLWWEIEIEVILFRISKEQN